MYFPGMDSTKLWNPGPPLATHYIGSASAVSWLVCYVCVCVVRPQSVPLGPWRSEAAPVAEAAYVE